MSLNPIIAKPVDFIGDTLVKADIATAGEVSALKGIAGYAKRDGFLGSIATVLHRVWNAFKAVFGQSDWQRAHRAAISFCDRNFTKMAKNELQRDEVKELVAKMKTKEGHQKIDEMFGEIIGFIDEANQKVKPYTALAPFVNQFIGAINQDTLVAALKEDLEGTLKEFKQDNMEATLGYAVNKGFIQPQALMGIMNNPQLMQMLAQ